MTRDEQEAILAIALMAAFADGRKTDVERDEVRRIVEALAAAGEPNLPALYQQVLLGSVTPASAAARLGAPELRRLAYEMAVGVCDADGARGDAERRFLAGLQQSLALDPVDAGALADRADALAEAPLSLPLPVDLEAPRGSPPAAVPNAVAPDASPAPAPAGPMLRSSSLTERELDDLITHAAILNGALELLPESVSTMAIIPLQMKLVYRIGKAYGYELDSGHVRDFLATAGVGLTSQYLEQAATRLVGGLLRSVGGRLLGGLGRQAASSAMSFASTWALGQVARRYYAGGRTLDAAALRTAFSGLLEEARTMQSRLMPQIEARAKTLDAQQVLRAIGG
ncbi:MAG: DUF533 domain-containing protein [Burkholderiales bacterium]|nr:MAG: DUF533 domain-containing protein [Burkholderiales bacterium]